MPEVPLSSYSFNRLDQHWSRKKQVQKLPQDYARTKYWSSRMKYSKQQLAFLVWAFNVGAKDLYKKLTPERAAEIMALLSTEDTKVSE